MTNYPTHSHVWKVARDQKDTGRVGIRLVCREFATPHYLTVIKGEEGKYIS